MWRHGDHSAECPTGRGTGTALICSLPCTGRCQELLLFAHCQSEPTDPVLAVVALGRYVGESLRVISHLSPPPKVR